MNKIGTDVPDPNMLMFTDEIVKDKRMSGQQMSWSRVGSQYVQQKCFIHRHQFSILPVLTLDSMVIWDRVLTI